MMAERGLSPGRRGTVGGTPAALIVILALLYTEPTAPTEAQPIGFATPMAAGHTFADPVHRVDFRVDDLPARRPLINRYLGSLKRPPDPLHSRSRGGIVDSSERRGFIAS